MLYVVVHERMFQKPDGQTGDLVEIEQPLTEETKQEVNEVWKAYDKAGMPFMFYHETESCPPAE